MSEYQTAPEWEPIKIKLGDLDHWDNNPKLITKAAAQRLLHSTKKLGRLEVLAIGPIQKNGKYPLYNGHQRANIWGSAFGMDLTVWALQSNRALTDNERKDVAVLTMTARGQFDWNILSTWDVQGDWGFDENYQDELKNDIDALEKFIAGEANEDEIDEETETIRPKQMARVLVSIPVDLAMDARAILDQLKTIDGVEIVYGAN